MSHFFHVQMLKQSIEGTEFQKLILSLFIKSVGINFSSSGKTQSAPPLNHVKKISDTDGSKLKSKVCGSSKPEFRSYIIDIFLMNSRILELLILTPLGSPVDPDVNNI